MKSLTSLQYLISKKKRHFYAKSEKIKLLTERTESARSTDKTLKCQKIDEIQDY